jgi:hypothetical protein
MVVLTHVPEALLSARAVWVLARVRWQVAIVFRVWKSRLRVEACRRRNVWRVWCEWYAKLMGVVMWALAVVGVSRGCVGSEFAQGVVCVSAVVGGVVGVFALWWEFRGGCGVV